MIVASNQTYIVEFYSKITLKSFSSRVCIFKENTSKQMNELVECDLLWSN